MFPKMGLAYSAPAGVKSVSLLFDPVVSLLIRSFHDRNSRATGLDQGLPLAVQLLELASHSTKLPYKQSSYNIFIYIFYKLFIYFKFLY